MNLTFLFNVMGLFFFFCQNISQITTSANVYRKFF